MGKTILVPISHSDLIVMINRQKEVNEVITLCNQDFFFFFEDKHFVEYSPDCGWEYLKEDASDSSIIWELGEWDWTVELEKIELQPEDVRNKIKSGWNKVIWSED